MSSSTIHNRGHGQHVVGTPAGVRGLWGRWALATTLGELAGFTVPAAVGAATWALGVPEGWQRFALVLAGVGEGALLGLAQSIVLARYLPGLRRRSWVLATALAAGIAWICGLALSNLGENQATNLTLLIGTSVFVGVVFLLSMGGAQWLVLRRHVERAGWWIAANALAWPLGVAVPVVALALLPTTTTPLVSGLVGVLSGVLMGVVVGAITGLVLVRLIAGGRQELRPETDSRWTHRS